MSRYLVKLDGETIGSVLTNRGMTDEEICEMAGVELAQTEEDYNGMPENGKYDISELEIVEESEEKEIKAMQLACEQADADYDNAVEHDYVTINKGRDGVQYAWYLDENKEFFVKVDTCEIIDFTQKEIDDLFL